RDRELTVEREVRAKLPRRGGTVVIRSYLGKDELGHETHAVRVASAQGVILAMGPLEVRDDRTRATRLLLAVADPESGRAFTSGGDVNGDGLADVILANDRGELELWRLTPNGSTRYEVEMTLPPRRAVDLGLDGVMDLEGWDDGDGTPRGPRLVARAAFDAGRWSSSASAAKSWHARMAAALLDDDPPEATALDGGVRDGGPARVDATSAARDGGASSPDGGAEPRKQSDDERLRRALERAWHRLRAGEVRSKVVTDLDALTVPATLRAWFDVHQRRVLRR
ncbi:MAG: VCBS repeat-containing protein, partial [Polyangiaceae bacterium]